MNLNIKRSTKFKRDLKRAISRGYNYELLRPIITKLANREPLPPENRDHPLSGDWTGCRECHIQADWLLIYRVRAEELELLLMRTGTHSDLFRE
ncbi:MAG: type II toxin-antitoxin system YafQ family toxin [Oscillospiraceae bacterium]|nr:type II toxin-antitoxin system YafQ family toxin [Oscillospiraceae bacterium]